MAIRVQAAEIAGAIPAVQEHRGGSRGIVAVIAGEHLRPRAAISPSSPAGNRSPPSPRIATSQPDGTPTVPGLRRAGGIGVQVMVPPSVVA
jgi:hypothetical protein